MNPKSCTVESCGGPHKGRGLCDRHLQRIRRTGTTASPVKSLAERFWSKVAKAGPDDCWLWTSATNEHGYGVMRPAGRRSGPTVKAHRVSAELAGMDVEGKSVLHSCDNPPCVNPAHLRPGTGAENMADALSRHRIPMGEARHTSRLTEIEVYAIRDLRNSGVPRDVVAEAFSTSGANVTAITQGKSWRHLNAVTPPAARDLIAAVAQSLGLDVAA